MVSIITAEIRWFIKGKIPSNIFDWFIGLNNNYVNQPVRTDYYLQLNSDDALGIKLREGRIEIKQRINQIGSISPGSNVSGIAEKWQKWSYELIASNSNLPDTAAQTKWMPVTKTRILINFGITEDNIITQKEEVTYKNGCLTEITSLKINNEEWWTIGLEAYGEEIRLKDNLILISHLILNDKSNIQLALKNSLSYPGWLKKMQI